MENGTKTTRVTAPDIVCAGCAGAIKKALGVVGGVENVDVDIESKIVTIDHSAAVSREQLVETLDRAGFPSS